MFSTDQAIFHDLPVLTALAFCAGCFGGSAEFASSAAAPEIGQYGAVPGESRAQPKHSTMASGPVAVSDDHGAVHWSYEGAGGPANWGGISADYSACSVGNRQSPIDLSSDQTRDLSGIGFAYRPTTLAIVNNGHTVQVDHHGDSYVSIGRWPYRLRQFHFHSPSEHTIDGQYADVEMHLVHQDGQGRLAVVGVMIESGEHNPAFDEVWQRLPNQVGNPQVFEDAYIDPDGLLPDDRNFFHYNGSLTTPPCSEGVSWFVMSSPITMSPEQIAQFKQIVDDNNRPIQQRYGRVLYSTSNQ